jgi:hypothetical protein
VAATLAHAARDPSSLIPLIGASGAVAGGDGRLPGPALRGAHPVPGSPRSHPRGCCGSRCSCPLSSCSRCGSWSKPGTPTPTRTTPWPSRRTWAASCSASWWPW